MSLIDLLTFYINLSQVNVIISVRGDFNLKRKITKIGNSLGVIIPSAFLEELGVTSKDSVNIEFSKEMNVITISKETIPNQNYMEQVVKSIVSDYLKEKGL